MTNSPESQKAANAKEDGPEKRGRRQRHSFNPETREVDLRPHSGGVVTEENLPRRKHAGALRAGL
jgi:hypothetical protein